jgi:light-regulated signal transduction histidine kinase (bacteriophytochrome)
LKDELEHHLRARTGELAAANRELEIYSRFLSRDLRTRLQAIVHSAHQVLAQHALGFDEATDPALAVVRKGMEHTEQLLDRLVAFTDLREKPMKLSKLDMTELVRAVFEELKRRFPEREIRFELDPLPPALGDQAEIRQVIAQLLSNAIKFTRGRNLAEITVSGCVEEAQNTYYVRDNGVGFPAQDEARLFGVFERLHQEEEFESVGLGLALVQRIIQRHGGQVGAVGSVNAGAVFCFTLPERTNAA